MDNIFKEGKDPLQVLWDNIEGNEHDHKDEECSNCYFESIDE